MGKKRGWHKVLNVAVALTLAVMLVVLFFSVYTLFSSLPVQADIAFVKNIGTNQVKGMGTSISITVPAAGVKAGNSIVVIFAMDSLTGSVSVSDSKGNTYTLDANVGATGAANKVRTLIFSTHNVTALVSGDTITVNHPSANARAVSANEFSGLWMTSTLDKTSTATGTSTMPSSGSTTTTSQADELLIGAIGVEGPLSDSFIVGTNYSLLSRDGTSDAVTFSNITINPEYRIVSATGAYAADGTIDPERDWAAAIATYKMLLWDSYESDYSTIDDLYDTSGDIIYMKGTGFAAGSYVVRYYDADATQVGTDAGITIGAGEDLQSQMACNTDEGATAGTWNAKVYLSDGTTLIADDTFTITSSAIPEFPTVISAFVVAGLCGAIYLWLRKRYRWQVAKA